MIVVPLCFHLSERRTSKKRKERLSELNSSPFPFSVDRGNELIFDLGEAKLHCDYTFGIRNDGVYGVDHLRMEGINCSWGQIDLKMGQSILPIIPKMDQFERWAEKQTFKTHWKASFKSNWDVTVQSIDNFKVIEYEDQKHKGL